MSDGLCPLKVSNHFHRFVSSIKQWSWIYEWIVLEEFPSPHVREYVFRNPGSFAWEIRNPGYLYLCYPEYWALDSGIHRKESRIPLTIGIQTPMTKYLESGIHGAQSRIQDCLGFLLNQWIFPGAQKTTGNPKVVFAWSWSVAIYLVSWDLSLEGIWIRSQTALKTLSGATYRVSQKFVPI